MIWPPIQKQTQGFIHIHGFISKFNSSRLVEENNRFVAKQNKHIKVAFGTVSLCFPAIRCKDYTLLGGGCQKRVIRLSYRASAARNCQIKGRTTRFLTALITYKKTVHIKESTGNIWDVNNTQSHLFSVTLGRLLFALG